MSTPALNAEIPEMQSSTNSSIKNVQDCQEAVGSCSKKQTNSENSSENEVKKLVKEKERGNDLLIRIHCNHLVAVSASVLIKLVTRKEKLHIKNTVQRTKNFKKTFCFNESNHFRRKDQGSKEVRGKSETIREFIH